MVLFMYSKKKETTPRDRKLLTQGNTTRTFMKCCEKKCVNHVQRTINIINAFTLIWVLVRRNVSFKIRNHPFSESHLFSKITQRHETTTSAFISTVHSTLTTIKYEKCDSVVGQMKPSIKWSIFILPLSIVIPNNFMIHDAGVNPQQILNNLYEEEKNFSF